MSNFIKKIDFHIKYIIIPLYSKYTNDRSS